MPTKAPTRTAQQTTQRQAGPNAGRQGTRVAGVTSGPSAGMLALQRTAGNAAAGTLLRPPAGGAAIQPGAHSLPAHTGLPTGGQPLDPGTRGYMEERFGHDFSTVRVHEESGPAGPAHALNARAYTLGQDIVFDHGEFAPHSPRGKRLLAHELSHVIQQSRGGSSPAPLRDSTLERHADQAVAAFEGSTGQVHVAGASGRGVARAPRSFTNTLEPGSLSDQELEQEIRQLQEWLYARGQVNDPDAEKATQALNRLEAEVHKRSNKQPPKPAPAKNPPMPGVSGDDRQELLNAMNVVQAIKPSETASGLYTTTYQGKEINLNQAQLDQLYAKARSAISDGLRHARSQAAGAIGGYNAQNEVDKKHWIVAPIIKTIGRVKDPGPFLIAEAARAQTSADAALVALGRKDFVEAARLLAEAETSAGKADKLWQAYFQGIISAGEMTITVLEYTRNAAFITLGVLAIIASGGAAAGATSAFGLEIGSGAAAANVIATGAPIVATLGEAGVKLALGDKVDWGKVALDVTVNLILSRFGGKMGEGIFKVIAGNPAAQTLGRVAVGRIVSSVLTHEVSTVFTTAVDATYRKLQGQNVTWDQFTDQVLARITDPKGIVIATVMGAVQTGAQVKYGGAKPGGKDVEQNAPPPKPAEEPTKAAVQQASTPAPQTAAPKPAKPAETATPAPAAKPAETDVPTQAPGSAPAPAPKAAAPTPEAATPAPETPKQALAAAPPAAKPGEAGKPPITEQQPAKYGETFRGLRKELKSVPEGEGPVVGRKLGEQEPAAGKPYERKPPTADETKRVGEMQAAREQRASEALKGTPKLRAEVENNKTVMGDGRTTLKDMAADSPGQLKEYWSDWNRGRASGDIKSSDFGQYVKIRLRGERGAYGEQTEAGVTGASDIMLKAPKTNVNEPGTDIVTFNPKSDRIKLIDNKAVREGAQVSGVSALERNLPKNLGDDIVDVQSYANQKGVPPEIATVVLPRLQAAKAAMDAHIAGKFPGKPLDAPEVRQYLRTPEAQKEFKSILDSNGIDRVVTTSGGGQNVSISSGLEKKGFGQE